MVPLLQTCDSSACPTRKRPIAPIWPLHVGFHALHPWPNTSKGVGLAAGVYDPLNRNQHSRITNYSCIRIRWRSCIGLQWEIKQLVTIIDCISQIYMITQFWVLPIFHSNMIIQCIVVYIHFIFTKLFSLNIF